jgi:PAS domain-containing protein
MNCGTRQPALRSDPIGLFPQVIEPSSRQEWIINTANSEGAEPTALPVEMLVKRAAAMLSEARSNEEGVCQLRTFDAFPAPIYATDSEGCIIYFNPACVDFAGRTPTLGSDRWSPSWQLEHDDGSPLPHDQCPMAVALREVRSVRGEIAVAQRPDGQRRRFRPFPTPALRDGRLVGAINLMVSTDGQAQRDLTATAVKCRELARWVGDDRARATLSHMASECEQQAAILRLD